MINNKKEFTYEQRLEKAKKDIKVGESVTNLNNKIFNFSTVTGFAGVLLAPVAPVFLTLAVASISACAYSAINCRTGEKRIKKGNSELAKLNNEK